jgi:thiol-disulfide isomerase/thioredoxin
MRAVLQFRGRWAQLALVFVCCVVGLNLAGWLTPATAQAKGGGSAKFLHRQKGKTLPELWNAELAAAEKAKQNVVVMFTADWCSPCQAIKDMAVSSSAIRKTLTKGRLLYIDVDEWRGPAHALIAGVNPTKLPTLVRVDKYGKQVQTCYGTDLGLLSDESVAHNLQRMFDGKPPEKPWYQGDADKERELMRAQQEAKARKQKAEPVLLVTGKNGDRTLTIHNHDGPRHWFLIPLDAAKGLSLTPNVTAWQHKRWNEHIRAEFSQFDGPQPFVAVAVSGYGSLTLQHFPLKGKGKGGQLEVWELNQLLVDGREPSAGQKLPYHLDIAEPAAVTVLGSGGKARLDIKLRAKHRAALR